MIIINRWFNTSCIVWHMTNKDSYDFAKNCIVEVKVFPVLN
jgi:hypothetical protein